MDEPSKFGRVKLRPWERPQGDGDARQDVGAGSGHRAVRAPRSGTLTGYDVRQVGMTVVELGGGRTRPDAVIDPAVGLSDLPRVGSNVETGEDMALIHAASEADWARAENRFLRSLEWDGDQDIPHVILDHHS